MAKKGEITVKDVSIRTMKVNGAWMHNVILMNTNIKNVKRDEKLPLGKLPSGNILYLCGIKYVN